MRGWYRALPLKEQAVTEALWELGCREGFFAGGETLAEHFVFEAGEEGWTEIGVRTEMGENLLVYSKMLGQIRFQKSRKSEN